MMKEQGWGHVSGACELEMNPELEEVKVQVHPVERKGTLELLTEIWCGQRTQWQGTQSRVESSEGPGHEGCVSHREEF